MTNIIQEHLRKADETVEVVELKQGNIWVYSTDGECIIFKSLNDFVRYIYLGLETERKYCKEDDLMSIYENATSWYDIVIPPVAKKTRANYESHLNEIHPFYEPFMEYLCTKSRKARATLDHAGYGTMLRKHDPIAFNVGFNEWKNN